MRHNDPEADARNKAFVQEQIDAGFITVRKDEEQTMSAQAAMQYIGEMDGKRVYWAEPGVFDNPGVYYWDGSKNVHLPLVNRLAVSINQLPVLWRHRAGEVCTLDRKAAFRDCAAELTEALEPLNRLLADVAEWRGCYDKPDAAIDDFVRALSDALKISTSA